MKMKSLYKIAGVMIMLFNFSCSNQEELNQDHKMTDAGVSLTISESEALTIADGYYNGWIFSTPSGVDFGPGQYIAIKSSVMK